MAKTGTEMREIVGIVAALVLIAVCFILVDSVISDRRGGIYDQAIIRLDGDVYYDVDVKSWRRINSNEVEITGTNGTIYRTHMNNVLLLGGGEK